MNPSAARAALIVGGIVGALFIDWMLVSMALYGCAASMPDEPSYTVTVASTRDH